MGGFKIVNNRLLFHQIDYLFHLRYIGRDDVHDQLDVGYLGDGSQSFVKRRDFDEVEWQEGFGFASLLLHILDAFLARGFRVHNDGVHVLAHDFGDGEIILLVSGLAKIDEAPVHARVILFEGRKEILHGAKLS